MDEPQAVERLLQRYLDILLQRHSTLLAVLTTYTENVRALARALVSRIKFQGF